MTSLGLFFLDLLVLTIAFRVLSTAGRGLPAWLRSTLAVLLVLCVAVATLWVECSAWTPLVIAAAVSLASTGLQGEGLAGMTDALGRLRLPLYILSVAGLAALIFLVVPVTTFLTSPGEIGLHLEFLIEVNARDAMVVLYVSLALYALAFTSRMKTVLTLLALGSFLIGLMYSFVLPFGYPMMTGLTFEQVPLSQPVRLLRFLLDALLIAGIALGLRFVLLRHGPRPILVGLLAISASLATATSIGVRGNLVGGAGDDLDSIQLADQPLRFSASQPNVLVIFLDRFMGSYVESILETDPQLHAVFEGFIWYPRTVSAGQNSIAGVHPLLGGYDYTPQEMNARSRNLRDQSVEAFSILPWNFARKGYEVNMVSPRGLGFTMAGDCNYLQIEGVNCTHIQPTVASRKAQDMGFPLSDLSTSNYSDLLVLLGAMRGAPYVFKEVLRTRGPWAPFMDHSAGTTFREWAELQALGDLTRTDAAGSNFNFVSNILAHEPYFLSEDCQPQPERFTASDETVRMRGHDSVFSLQHAIGARCVLLGVGRYMEFLQNSGVYGNTRIVIVSDHGIVGRVRDNSSRAVAGGTEDNRFVRARSLLMVKEAGATGPLRVSEEFLPNAEVPRIACIEIDGCVNPYLGNKPIATAGRNEPFLVSIVPWQFSMQNLDSFVLREQMVLTGKDPFDAQGWSTIPSPRTQ